MNYVFIDKQEVGGFNLRCHKMNNYARDLVMSDYEITKNQSSHRIHIVSVPETPEDVFELEFLRPDDNVYFLLPEEFDVWHRNKIYAYLDDPTVIYYGGYLQEDYFKHKVNLLPMICTNCGGHINMNTMSCQSCGTHFVMSYASKE